MFLLIRALTAAIEIFINLKSYKEEGKKKREIKEERASLTPDIWNNIEIS
jgi:hypothetical protein